MKSLAYYDVEEEQVYSAVVPAALARTKCNVWKAVVGAYWTMETYGLLLHDLQDLPEMDSPGSGTASLKDSCGKLEEVMRMALWFHNYGENILQLIETEKIGKSFLDRVDVDGS